MEMISESTKSVAELLNLLDLRSKQVDRLIATVRKDRNEMKIANNRVANLVTAATHFARKGACLSLKTIQRGNTQRKLSHAFDFWRRIALQATIHHLSNIPPPRQSVGNSPLQNHDQISLPSSPISPMSPESLSSTASPLSSVALAAAKASEEADRLEKARSLKLQEEEVASLEILRKQSSETPLDIEISAHAHKDEWSANEINKRNNTNEAQGSSIANAGNETKHAVDTQAHKKGEEEGQGLFDAASDEPNMDVSSELSSSLSDMASAWQQVLEESSGDAYWWNRATDEVTWDTPDEILKMEMQQDNVKQTRVVPKEALVQEAVIEYDQKELPCLGEDKISKDKQEEETVSLEMQFDRAAEEEKKALQIIKEQEQAEEKATKAKKEAEEEEAEMMKKRKEKKEAEQKAFFAAQELIVKEEEAAEQLRIKKELDKAAQDAKLKVLAIYKESQDKIENEKLQLKREEAMSVAGLAEKMLRKVCHKLYNIVIQCSEEDSFHSLEALALWNELQKDFLLILKQENEMNVKRLTQEVELDFDALNDIKQSNLIAMHVLIEVVSKELSKLRDRFLLKQALQVTPPSSTGVSLFNRPPGSELLLAAQCSQDHKTNGNDGEDSDGSHDELVKYIIKIVKNYSYDPLDGSKEKDGVKKAKKFKKGGGLSPRPVNHPVLSSPLVLKIAPDFHPKNAQALGELASTGRLADALLQSLLDEVILELSPATDEDVPIPTTSTRIETESAELLSQWRQSIHEASSVVREGEDDGAETANSTIDFDDDFHSSSASFKDVQFQ